MFTKRVEQAISIWDLKFTIIHPSKEQLPKRREPDKMSENSRPKGMHTHVLVSKKERQPSTSSNIDADTLG